MSKTEWDLCVFTDNRIRWKVNQQLLFKASSTSIGSQRGGLDSTTISSDFVGHSFDFFFSLFRANGPCCAIPWAVRWNETTRIRVLVLHRRTNRDRIDGLLSAATPAAFTAFRPGAPRSLQPLGLYSPLSSDEIFADLLLTWFSFNGDCLLTKDIRRKNFRILNFSFSKNKQKTKNKNKQTKQKNKIK